MLGSLPAVLWNKGARCTVDSLEQFCTVKQGPQQRHSVKLFLKHCCQFLRQHQWKWGYFNLPFELLQGRTRNLLNISQTESSEPALTTEFTGVVSWTGLKTSPRIIWCLYRKQIALSYLKIYKCDCFIWWFPRKDAQFGLSTYGRLWSFFLVGY